MSVRRKYRVTLDIDGFQKVMYISEPLPNELKISKIPNIVRFAGLNSSDDSIIDTIPGEAIFVCKEVDREFMEAIYEFWKIRPAMSMGGENK